MRISVLTIVRGRRRHLLNQMAGLVRSVQLPLEWVIVGMGEDVVVDAETEFPVRIGKVDCDASHIPLAAARNRAAQLAAGDGLLFLDVDCIPSVNLIQAASSLLSNRDGLWMGSIGYLPADWSQTCNGTSNQSSIDEPRIANDLCRDEDLESISVHHPLLPQLDTSDVIESGQYELFWSLCFAIRRKTYQKVLGFDESFKGYGGEDTDFAFTARLLGVPFGFFGAKAYHQHHTVCKPPLNHLESIVENAEAFKKKWGTWPMEKWLEQFDQSGFIKYNPDLDHIEVVRVPNEKEIEAATVDTPAGF